MNRKKKIAIGLCMFLTITPFIGLYIWQDTTLGKYVGTFTPYIHFTMPELEGPPFAEAFGELIAICIFLVGLIGLIVFVATKFKKVGGLLLLLYLTIIYCGFRALGAITFNIFSFSNYGMKAKLFLVAAIFADIACPSTTFDHFKFFKLHHPR
jgi:hypothetical protein